MILCAAALRCLYIESLYALFKVPLSISRFAHAHATRSSSSFDTNIINTCYTTLLRLSINQVVVVLCGGVRLRHERANRSKHVARDGLTKEPQLIVRCSREAAKHGQSPQMGRLTIKSREEVVARPIGLWRRGNSKLARIESEASGKSGARVRVPPAHHVRRHFPQELMGMLTPQTCGSQKPT